jgi:MutS domain V
MANEIASQTPLLQASLARAQALSRRRKRLEPVIVNAKAKIRSLQAKRVYSGILLGIALLIAAMKRDLPIGLPAFVIFAPVFTVFVMQSRAWNAFLVKLERLDAFFVRQEARLRGKQPPLAGQNLHSDESFGSDLGFFGSYSLWTLIDETLTEEGSQELKSWLIAPPADLDTVRTRQNDIKALRKDAWFYTRLGLIAERKELGLSTQQILEFISREVVPGWYLKAYVGVLALWFVLLGSVFIETPMMEKLRPLFFAAFAISHLALLLKAGPVFKKGAGVSHHLGLLAPIFSAVEKRTTESETLRALCPTIHVQGPSKHARRINRVVSMLGTEANPILHLLLNAIVPWATTGALWLEHRRAKLGDSFAISLKELAQIEALFSIVLLDRYQTSVYPELTSEHISFRGMFHPLIDRTHVIPNDFEFGAGKSLGLLTGSNMSGKSTFLRTIGVNQALANIGAPVFAESFATRPLKIESCIEVSDSLRDGFSYFYAEVRRLKYLLEETKTGHSLFLIDEIFRGTNNRERQIGSRAVIRSLAKAAGAQGFISTHDLELTSLETIEPTLINLHFREQIIEGKMAFSYKLQRGASPTTNALRIMALEGLPVEEDESVLT